MKFDYKGYTIETTFNGTCVVSLKGQVVKEFQNDNSNEGRAQYAITFVDHIIEENYDKLEFVERKEAEKGNDGIQFEDLTTFRKEILVFNRNQQIGTIIRTKKVGDKRSYTTKEVVFIPNVVQSDFGGFRKDVTITKLEMRQISKYMDSL